MSKKKSKLKLEEKVMSQVKTGKPMIFYTVAFRQISPKITEMDLINVFFLHE